MVAFNQAGSRLFGGPGIPLEVPDWVPWVLVQLQHARDMPVGHGAGSGRQQSQVAPTGYLPPARPRCHQPLPLHRSVTPGASWQARFFRAPFPLENKHTPPSGFPTVS